MAVKWDEFQVMQGGKGREKRGTAFHSAGSVSRFEWSMSPEYF